MAITSGSQISLRELLVLYFSDACPADTDAAQEAINRFFTCGEAPKSATEAAKTLVYSFTEDEDVMIAAFQQVYGMDLYSVELHWWRFCALLRGLLSHSFTERVKYRMCDPSQIKDKTMRSQWQRLQAEYRLDAHGQKRQEPQTLEELNEMLLRQARGER